MTTAIDEGCARPRARAIVFAADARCRTRHTTAGRVKLRALYIGTHENPLTCDQDNIGGGRNDIKEKVIFSFLLRAKLLKGSRDGQVMYTSWSSKTGQW